MGSTWAMRASATHSTDRYAPENVAADGQVVKTSIQVRAPRAHDGPLGFRGRLDLDRMDLHYFALDDLGLHHGLLLLMRRDLCACLLADTSVVDAHTSTDMIVYIYSFILLF